MKKVLYIDYDLQVGHVNFNRIQIDALRATGADVHLVLHQFMFEHLPYPREMYDWIVPTILRYRDGHPLLNRLVFILTLILIRMKVNIGRYDKVILGYCDEISLRAVPPAKHMYIFMHRTAGIAESGLKRRLCQSLGNANTFLVFNHHMGDMLDKAGIHSYHIISHGCVEPFDVKRSEKPSDSFTIFHPSAKLNEKFVRDILKNPDVLDFLKQNNIRIVLKECECTEKILHENIMYLPSRIDFDEYRQRFADADAILLSYPESFSGQVSGISYECVANHKRIMVYEHPSLVYCKDFCNYNPIFGSAEDFMALCSSLSKDDNLICTASAMTLAPDYSFIKQTSLN